jgi:hypothetical protein
MMPFGAPKNILFTETEGAEEHCQCGAASLSNQRIFDWLDQTFNTTEIITSEY